MNTIINYTRKVDTDDSKFTVEVNGRTYDNVSAYSAYRIKRWIDNQFPRVTGGSNYYGGHYQIDEVPALEDQLAALTAERDAQQSLIKLVMSRVALLEAQRDTLLAFVNGKLTRAEMEESLSKFEGVTLR